MLAVALVVFPFREASAQIGAGTSFRPVTRAMLADPDPADWLMWRGGYSNWGYSPLDQISRNNVTELRMAWSYAFAPAGPASRGMQVEPIVYDGVMYVRHAIERYTAHDATTGDVIWEYSRQLAEEITEAGAEARGQFGFTVHRGGGVFLYEDKLIGHSTDGMLFALNPRTGVLLWQTEMLGHRRGQQPSGAPVAFDGVIAVPYNCHRRHAQLASVRWVPHRCLGPPRVRLTEPPQAAVLPRDGPPLSLASMMSSRSSAPRAADP